jgi:DNA-binding PadR family transcriptional regulator
MPLVLRLLTKKAEEGAYIKKENEKDYCGLWQFNRNLRRYC